MFPMSGFLMHTTESELELYIIMQLCEKVKLRMWYPNMVKCSFVKLWK
jgi:hypothetical protein